MLDYPRVYPHDTPNLPHYKSYYLVGCQPIFQSFDDVFGIAFFTAEDVVSNVHATDLRFASCK